MEHMYTSYTKLIDSKTHFFVKKFLVFPEINGIPPMLESFGMHTDFDKACNIACVTDIHIKQQLLEEIENNTPMAKVIDLSESGFVSKRIVGL